MLRLLLAGIAGVTAAFGSANAKEGSKLTESNVVENNNLAENITWDIEYKISNKSSFELMEKIKTGDASPCEIKEAKYLVAVDVLKMLRDLEQGCRSAYAFEEKATLLINGENLCALLDKNMDGVCKRENLEVCQQMVEEKRACDALPLHDEEHKFLIGMYKGCRRAESYIYKAKEEVAVGRQEFLACSGP